MNQHSTHTAAVCATILLVGVIFSAVVWVSLARLNQNFATKYFYDPSGLRTTNAYQTVRLNDRQFVVVSPRGEVLNVYQVDAKGKLSRTE